MKYKEILCKVKNLKGGEILSRQLFNKENTAVLFQANHKLNPSHINTLQKKGIDSVFILVQVKNDDSNNEEDKQNSKQLGINDVEMIGIKDPAQIFDKKEGCLKIDSKKVSNLHVDLVDFSMKMLNKVTSDQPFDMNEIKESVNHIIINIKDNLEAMINLVHLKDTDAYTFMHSVNVSVLAAVMGMELELPENEVHILGVGGILHDVGKMKIDLKVLNKNGKLSEEEFNEIKGHTTKGYKVLKERGVEEKIAYMALTHHEKLNGKGYPLGIDKNKIPKFSKIISVCDVYDALTADRVYKKAMHPYEAIEIIKKGNDTSFDSMLVTTLQNTLGMYPVSSTLILSDGSVARVIKQNKESLNKPVIEILNDRYGKIPAKKKIIDLSGINNLAIKSIFKS